VPEIYDKVQEEQNLVRVAEAANYNAWLISRAATFVGGSILDFGAGLGTLTMEFAGSDADVVAVEPDAHYRRRLDREFSDRQNVRIVSSLDKLEAEEKFDAVASFNVFEHIDDDRTVARRLIERLAPGGHMLVLVPAHRFLYGPNDESVGHCRRYSRADVVKLLEPLSIVEARAVNPLGAIGWFAAGRVLRRSDIPAGPLRFYDRLVPALRSLDRLHIPFGLSIWAVGRR
jgi:SAM-dependent methyltransferase